MERATWMPPAASCAWGRHQPPDVSASSANVTLPPSVGLAFDVVGVVPVPLLALLPPLPLLEHAAALRAKTTATEAMVKWWRARSLVATFPPVFDTGSRRAACVGPV